MSKLFANFEQMIAPEKRPHQYIAHAGGASKLISVRGPQCVRTNFEYKLFRTQRGRIVSRILWHSYALVVLELICYIRSLMRCSEANIVSYL